MPKKNRKLAHTSIRLKENLIHDVDTYADFRNITRNEAIEEILERGMSISVYRGLVQNLKADLENRWLANAGNLPTFKIYNTALIMKRDNNQCQKCKSTQNLEIFHINRDQTDFDVKNVLTLCNSCAEKAKMYIAKEFLQESFAVWLYLIKDF